MLTVWCMCTGDAYDPEYVHTLKRMVDRHLSETHIFTCITEHEIEGIGTLKPLNDIPGFWGKVNLFSGSVSHTRNLWLDLDVAITGALDGLCVPLVDSQLRICKNWAQSGHGGCQSSVMYWEGVSARIIHDEFDRSIANWPPTTNTFWPNGQVQYGDQEWITVLRDTQRLEVEYFDSQDISSYKYHCRQGLPEGTKVAVFHGSPKPHEVGAAWVKQCRA